MIDKYLSENILLYHNPYEKNFNLVISELKKKFSPPRCLCCRRVRYIVIFLEGGKKGFCSKSCYRYYHGINVFD